MKHIYIRSHSMHSCTNNIFGSTMFSILGQKDEERFIFVSSSWRRQSSVSLLLIRCSQERWTLVTADELVIFATASFLVGHDASHVCPVGCHVCDGAQPVSVVVMRPYQALFSRCWCLAHRLWTTLFQRRVVFLPACRDIYHAGLVPAWEQPRLWNRGP